MTFKFVARNTNSGKTGSVNVKASREQEARQKLQAGGYEVLHLVSVSNGQESGLKVFTPAGSASRVVSHTMASPAMGGGWMSNLFEVVSRFESWFLYR